MTAKRRPNDCDQVVTVRECGGVGNLSHETMRSLVRNRRGEEVEKRSYFATTFQPPADPMSSLVSVFQLFSIKYNAEQRWKGVMSVQKGRRNSVSDHFGATTRPKMVREAEERDIKRR